jgi:hypothetical protein
MVQPPAESPVMVQPPAESPVMVQPPAESPVMVQLPAESPVMVQPPAESPVMVQPPAESPVMVQPPAESPVMVQPPAESPVMVQPPTQPKAKDDMDLDMINSIMDEMKYSGDPNPDIKIPVLLPPAPTAPKIKPAEPKNIEPVEPKKIKSKEIKHKKNILLTNQSGVGSWGGICTCPDGEEIMVGDNNDGCKSLACINGTPGPCEMRGSIRRNGRKAICGLLISDQPLPPKPAQPKTGTPLVELKPPTKEVPLKPSVKPPAKEVPPKPSDKTP